MSLVATPYYDLHCQGRIDNIRHPNCPSVSPGGFEQEDVVKRALGLGWTEVGKGHHCPGCSFVVPDATIAAPRRRQKSAPTIEAEHFEQQS